MWQQPKKKPISDLFEKLAKLMTKTAEVEMQRKAIRGLGIVRALSNSKRTDTK